MKDKKKWKENREQECSIGPNENRKARNESKTKTRRIPQEKSVPTQKIEIEKEEKTSEKSVPTQKIEIEKGEDLREKYADQKTKEKKGG